MIFDAVSRNIPSPLTRVFAAARSVTNSSSQRHRFAANRAATKQRVIGGWIDAETRILRDNTLPETIAKR